jgi:hypothetical protein
MLNTLFETMNIVPTVPLRSAAAPAPAAPQLTYRGGPLIQNVNVFCVFWGSDWQNSPASDIATQVTQFFQYIVTSPLIDQLGEYSTNGYTIGQGQLSGTTVITNPDPSSTVDDSDIQNLLQNQITSGALPAPDANTVYFVFTPSGITVTLQGSSSCQQFCGYHDDINGQIFYAVQPYPDCSGCSTGGADIDAITEIASHELSEAITDPIPGQGWYDDSNGEIGDICAWQTKMLDQWTVQLEWSNNANACV